MSNSKINKGQNKNINEEKEWLENVGWATKTFAVGREFDTLGVRCTCIMYLTEEGKMRLKTGKNLLTYGNPDRNFCYCLSKCYVTSN